MEIELIGHYNPEEILRIESDEEEIGFSENDYQPEIKAIIFPETCLKLANSYKAKAKNSLKSIFPNLEEIIWPVIGRMKNSQFAHCEKLKYFQTTSCKNLAAYAFQLTELESIVLPRNLNRIGKGCFLGCSNLKSVDVSAVKKEKINIPELCFSHCVALTEFDFERCLSIGEYSFNQSGIKEAIFSKDWTGEISKYAFSHSRLNSIKIDGNVKLNQGCFSDCLYLETVQLNSNIGLLPNSAFRNDENLRDISGVEGVFVIEDYCFERCSLTNMDNFKNLDRIGLGALSGNKFKELTLNVSQIGDYAFNYCLELKKIRLTSPKLNFLPRSLFTKGNPTEIWDLEQTGITRIEKYTCENSLLKEIILPKGLKSIGKYAFSKSNLSRVIIPPSVTDIECGAFFCCSHLKEVVWSSACKKIQKSTFSACYQLAILSNLELVEEIEEFAFSDTSIDLAFPNLKKATISSFGGYSGVADLRKSSVEIDEESVARISVSMDNVLLPYFYNEFDYYYSFY